MLEWSSLTCWCWDKESWSWWRSLLTFPYKLSTAKLTSSVISKMCQQLWNNQQPWLWSDVGSCIPWQCWLSSLPWTARHLTWMSTPPLFITDPTTPCLDTVPSSSNRTLAQPGNTLIFSILLTNKPLTKMLFWGSTSFCNRTFTYSQSEKCRI